MSVDDLEICKPIISIVKTIELSERFDIDDIRKIRDYNAERYNSNVYRVGDNPLILTRVTFLESSANPCLAMSAGGVYWFLT